jgi:hypothetical protein
LRLRLRVRVRVRVRVSPARLTWRCGALRAASTGDLDHIWIVGSYFHYAGGFEAPAAVDISPNKGRSDPMYVVYARKLAA